MEESAKSIGTSSYFSIRAIILGISCSLGSGASGVRLNFVIYLWPAGGRAGDAAIGLSWCALYASRHAVIKW